MLDRAAIAAYVHRDWKAVARIKTAAWLAMRRRQGVAGSFRVANELRAQVLSQRPDWPTSDERMDDALTHVRVSLALRRVTSRRR